ncbi:MAG TPA: magnesium transporter CorA family protein [Candidatus Limnocylindria bacterium]|jgi:magnesium transporter|nr:magnesium transporter CorA family protein [Candidatus Limnocylindria bacterium]
MKAFPRLRRPRDTGSPIISDEPRGEPRPEIIETRTLRWINIDEPRLADRQWLAENFPFHELDLEDVASHNQRPKVDEYDEYLFLVMQFPRFDKETGRLHAAELDIFIGPDYVITLPNDEIVPLPALFERVATREDVREQLMSKGSGYLLYEILDRCVDASFPMLGQLGRKLRRLEDDIFEGGRSSESVREISNAKQEIINFRAVIRPQRAVFRSLERAKQRYLTEDLDIYFDDLTDASERIWDVLENFKEIVEGLEGTNESVLSHRLNDGLRVLTAVSVILLPLTLLASIFGMNVHFPGESSPEAFWAILVAMLIILFGMIAFFRRRGWL